MPQPSKKTDAASEQQQQDDESSEEEFNVDDYLNTTTSTTTTVPTRVSFTGVGGDSSSDNNKDATEESSLRREIQQVQTTLSQAQIDLSHEKIVRRKAERNLVKLAKEFQKLKSEEFTMQQNMSQLRVTNASLEAKLGALRQELQERIQTKEESLRNHQDELLEMQRRYREACRGHEARVAELNRTHSAEVEDLRRQLGNATQDSDRLRSKLVTLEVKEAERIAERAISSNMDSNMNGISTAEYNGRSRGKESFRWKRFVLAGVAVLFAAFYQITGLSMDAVCSPVMAGTRLNKEGIWEAPWWAPENFKERAFQVCGDRPRTATVGTFDSNGSYRITIREVGDTPKTLLERKVSSALVKVDRIDLMLERKGTVEAVKIPWAR